MKIGILGTGIVGTTLGSHFSSKGHQVMLGSRSRRNEIGENWLAGNKENRCTGNFNDAASYADVVINCTMGTFSLDALRLIDKENLTNKILIDVANPLDFSAGMPPRLTVCNDTSLGEEIQKLLPATKVVKALNTVSVDMMTQPAPINNSNIDMFLCGTDGEAKVTVIDIFIKECGWHRENIIDLGEMIHARSTEMLVMLMCSMAMKFGSFDIGIKTLLK